MSNKPLGRKAYGSIGHFPHSRMGKGDHHVAPGQDVICTVKKRDKHDKIIVEEKIDGSCTAVARVDGEIVALGRAGYLAQTSPYEQHQLFAYWVRENENKFKYLPEGHRMVGEWVAQAHGTRYDLGKREPWIVFDIMIDSERLPREAFWAIAGVAGLDVPYLIGYGDPMTVKDAMESIGEFGKHGALDPVEGVVYRVEREGKVDFLAKYVRPDKIDGTYLPEISGEDAVWNWRPKERV